MEALSFEIRAELDKMNRGLAKASASIEKFSKDNEAKLKKFAANSKRIGQNLSVGLTLPILAIGAASVKAASDFEETESKFNTVFRNIGKDANEAAEELRKSFGLSSKASLQLLGDTGDLLTGFGFSQKAALDLSTEVNKLAVDLASFTNFSGGAEGASQALTKALLGERESVKSLGISILETDVQARVLKNTQEGLTFESERQAKAFATLQIAQEQSKNAIGDYARTNQSFANQMRLVQARVSDLSVEFGKILLPYALKLTKIVSGLVERFRNLDQTTKKIIVVIAGLVAVVGPLLLALGGIASILPAILTGLAALTGPVGLVIAAIGALTFAVIKNWDTVKAWAQDIANYFINLYNESMLFRVGIEYLITNFKLLWDVASFVVKSLWTVFKTNFKNMIAVLTSFGTVLEGVLTFDSGKIKQGVKDFANTLTTNIAVAMATIANDANELFASVEENLKNNLNNVLTGKKEPVNFDVSEESKKKLEDEVADAVQKGAAKGMGRPQQESVNALGATSGIQQSQPLTGETFQRQVITENLNGITEEMLMFNEDMNNLINGTLANTFSQLGNSIGDAMAQGKSVVGAIGQSLVQSFGRFISDMGDLLIQYGLMAKAKGAIDVALTSAFGAGTIAAGAAAVAVGVALKAAGAAIGSRAQGGFSGGTGASASQTPQNFTQTFSANQNQLVRFRIQGRDLVGVLRNENEFGNIIAS